MRTSLVTGALKAAAPTRGTLAGAIFRADRGSVYRSQDYARLGAGLSITKSMVVIGSSADNALAESFNTALEREVLQDGARCADEPACRQQVFRWSMRHNTQRRHSWCGYRSR